jgi:antitoxin component YwqK of YwqJK toxin-antitoxin module
MIRRQKLLKLSFLFITSFLFFSCGEEKQEEKPLKEEKRPLVTEEDGVYTEWYPGHKQIKVKGRKNAEGKKEGVWKMFTEDGYDLSIQTYKDGKRDGAVIVYHPNGALHYSGDYENDERVGTWKFYNEMGELVNTENFDASETKEE